MEATHVTLFEGKIKEVMTKDSVFNAMLHAAAATIIKATTPELVSDDGSCLSTCTKVLSEEVGISPEELQELHNLMGVISKPVHGESLRSEPPIHLCQVQQDHWNSRVVVGNSKTEKEENTFAPIWGLIWHSE